MAALIWADVIAIAPQLDSPKVPVDGRTMILGFANELVADNYGGDDSFRYKMARAYLAAHMGQLTLEHGKNEVQTKTMGTTTATVTYATFRSMMSKTGLELTPYGVQFEAIQQTSLGRVGFVL